jgi:hypothetical protein
MLDMSRSAGPRLRLGRRELRSTSSHRTCPDEMIGMAGLGDVRGPAAGKLMAVWDDSEVLRSPGCESGITERGQRIG